MVCRGTKLSDRTSFVPADKSCPLSGVKRACSSRMYGLSTALQYPTLFGVRGQFPFSIYQKVGKKAVAFKQKKRLPCHQEENSSNNSGPSRVQPCCCRS